MSIIVEPKKEAMLLLSMIRDSVAVYVVKSTNNESTESLSIEVPIIFDIAEIVNT
jgi:hypothetical protein